MGIREYLKDRAKSTIWFGSTQTYNSLPITGGTVINDGTTTYHVFTEPGIFFFF